MSVKLTAKQEKDVELAFELIGALGGFIGGLSDDVVKSIHELPALKQKVIYKQTIYLKDIENIIEHPLLQNYPELIELKTQISSRICKNIKGNVEKNTGMQLLNEETLEDGSVLLTISV